MGVLESSSHGDVVLLRWNDGENRFRGDSVADWHTVVDDLESREGPLAVVVTGAGKFFSNGLDLDWMGANGDAGSSMLADLHRLFGRLLTLPAFTVAAINGHAFAGGAMLTCCFDRRVMRSDRGYWCLPEVDLGLPLTDAMFAVVAAKLPHAALHESIVTGRRFAAPDAVAAGIVDAVDSDEVLVESALELAASMASKDRRVIARHKQQMYGEAARICGV